MAKFEIALHGEMGEIGERCNSAKLSAKFRHFLGSLSYWPLVSIPFIDKVYIDGPCGSKTLASVLLALFRKSESCDSLLKIGPIGAVHNMQYSRPLEFSNSNVSSTIGPENFLITKKVK